MTSGGHCDRASRSFKFGNIHEGTYRLKITLDGFPSVVGTVVLQKHAKNSEAIRIEMPLMPLG